MAQLGHVWTQVGLSMRNLVGCVGASGAEVGPKTDRPSVGNMACTPSSKKNRGTFQHIA